MRILVVTLPTVGHTLPLVPLAWTLRAAGHDVLFATAGEAVEFATRAGMGVIKIAEGDILKQARIQSQPPASGKISIDDVVALDALIERLRNSRTSPDTAESPAVREALDRHNKFFTAIWGITVDAIIRVATRWRADAILYEAYMAVGLLAAKAVGIPAFRHDICAWHMVMEPTPEAINDVRRRYGLVGEPCEPTAIINICPASIRKDSYDFDWPMRFVPYNNEAIVPEWLLEHPERPRVCLTAGTIVPEHSNADLLEGAIETLSAFEAEVILLGGAKNVPQTLPDNVRSVGWLPLNAVLSTCSAVIHHGGSGTMFTALAAGVPQMIIPQFADQPVNATAVAARGVGVHLPEDQLDTVTLREQLDRLLYDEKMSEAAAEVRAEMAAMPPVSAVAHRLVTATAEYPPEQTF